MVFFGSTGRTAPFPGFFVFLVQRMDYGLMSALSTRINLSVDAQKAQFVLFTFDDAFSYDATKNFSCANRSITRIFCSIRSVCVRCTLKK